MKRFLAEPVLVRRFACSGDFSVYVVGYNDFTVVEPAKTPYMQTFYTLHYVISGHGTLEACGRTFSLGPGELFFLPPDKEMCYYPDENDPWEYVWFTFIDEKAASYGRVMGFTEDNPVRDVRGRSAAVLLLLRDLFNAIQRDEDDEYLVLSAFYQLVHICAGVKRSTDAADLKQMIDDAFTMPDLSIDALCRAAGMSHAHFCRLFRAKYQETAVQYLIGKRLDYACRLLATTDLTIKSVAYSCGYTEDVHFIHAFKKRFGMTASQYRKNAVQHAFDAVPSPAKSEDLS